MATGLPDHTQNVQIQGEYTGIKKTVALDDAGRIIAMLKGMYGTTPTDLAVDTAGNIMVNLAVQDLPEVIFRPKYGGMASIGAFATITANTTTTLVNVSGTGMLYGGFIYLDVTTDQKEDKFDLIVDGSGVGQYSFYDYFKRNLVDCTDIPFRLKILDLDQHRFCIALIHGVTFESSIKLTYTETAGNSFTVNYRFAYAVI